MPRRRKRIRGAGFGVPDPKIRKVVPHEVSPDINAEGTKQLTPGGTLLLASDDPSALKGFVLPHHHTLCLVGSHVNNYLGLNRGALYGKFPDIHARPATGEEKKYLSDHGVLATSNLVKVTIVPLTEVERIVKSFFPVFGDLRVRLVGQAARKLVLGEVKDSHEKKEKLMNEKMGVNDGILDVSEVSPSMRASHMGPRVPTGPPVIGPMARHGRRSGYRRPRANTRKPPKPNRYRRSPMLVVEAGQRGSLVSPYDNSSYVPDRAINYHDTFPISENGAAVVLHCQDFVADMKLRLFRYSALLIELREQLTRIHEVEIREPDGENSEIKTMQRKRVGSERENEGETSQQTEHHTNHDGTNLFSIPSSPKTLQTIIAALEAKVDGFRDMWGDEGQWNEQLVPSSNALEMDSFSLEPIPNSAIGTKPSQFNDFKVPTVTPRSGRLAINCVIPHSRSSHYFVQSSPSLGRYFSSAMSSPMLPPKAFSSPLNPIGAPPQSTSPIPRSITLPSLVFPSLHVRPRSAPILT